MAVYTIHLHYQSQGGCVVVVYNTQVQKDVHQRFEYLDTRWFY